MIRILAGLLLGIGLPLVGWGNSGTASVLQVAFPESAFNGVNRADAIAAVSTWAEQLAHNRNLQITARVTIYPDAHRMFEAARNGQADLISMSAMDLVSMPPGTPVVPYFLATRQGSPFDRYLLLVRADGGIHHLRDLGQQAVIEQSLGLMSGAGLWLDTLLAKQGLPPLSKDRIRVIKATEAVLPVFFGSKAACVATEKSYRSMVELNPQVGRTLRVLAQSEPLASGIIAVRTDYQEHRQAALEELANLAKTPSGQQILTLMRYEDVVPFSAAALDSTRALLEAQGALARTASLSAPTEARP